jgi:Microtubule-associated protein CRIPT.
MRFYTDVPSQSKLLSAKAKNPYAAYASSCDNCKVKTEQGKKFCQRCAYQKNGMFDSFLASRMEC